MDRTAPYHRSTPYSQTKSASRLARTGNSIIQSENRPPVLSLDLISSSPRKIPSSPSLISLKSSTNSPPLQQILLLSPTPRVRSRTRLVEMAEEGAELTGNRRRCKSRGTQLANLGCNSPKNHRKSRRRVEMEVKEERDLGLMEENGKARKRRHSGKSKKEKEKEKEKLSLVPLSNLSPKIDDSANIDQMGEMIIDLVMWRDVAKSSLWFGFGCMCFFSSCLDKGVNFSVFSALSQLGLLFLGASFLSNSICRRDKSDRRLREEDLLRLARLTVAPMNLAISKIQELFSGEPSMTLKVAPLLLLGAEYGQFITLRRLFAFGFFISFTVPKLYSNYSDKINNKAEYTKQWLVETWGSCSHKKLVAASAITAFWKLSSVKTRILTAFITLVMIRYCRQHLMRSSEPEGEEEQNQALVVVPEHSYKL